MKISKSKQELARIISDNGGWREGAEWAVQDEIIAFFSGGKPEYIKGGMIWSSNGFDCNYVSGIEGINKIPNWHQTILSRDEYFNLCQAKVEVVVESKTACHLTVTDKPTIEQLAADYRNAKDYAEQKQREADEAKADADEALRNLELAGEEIGLIVTPITAKQESELVITD